MALLLPVEVVSASGTTLLKESLPRTWSVRDLEEALLARHNGVSVKLATGGRVLSSGRTLGAVLAEGDVVSAAFANKFHKLERFELHLCSRKEAERLVGALDFWEAPVKGWYLTCTGKEVTGEVSHEGNPRSQSLLTAGLDELVQALCAEQPRWQIVVLSFKTW